VIRTLNFAAIVLVLGLLLREAWPPNRGVRLRNALLLDGSRPEDFAWKPPAIPPDFRLESHPAPPLFEKAVAELGARDVADAWERALLLAGHLSVHARDLGAIQSDLHTTYRRIMNGYGYCADFCRVYLGLASAAGLLARQWSFSFDGFGGHGHVVVEVFDPQRGKWLFLDVYNNFHAVDANSGEVLDALEFRDYVLGTRANVEWRANGAGRMGFKTQEGALRYYRRGVGEWYLWWGNDVFSVESRAPVRLLSRLSGPLGQAAATLTGAMPRIRALVTEENAQVVTDLLATGRRTRRLGKLLAGLFLVLSVSVVAPPLVRRWTS
jgi:hypothetical protein